MRHVTQSVLPSTITGIKRLARSICRQDQIQHSQALEVAAKRCGYESFHHARRSLERVTATGHSSKSYSIYLSAYWRDTSTKPAAAGLETVKVELPRPLLSFLRKHQCDSARNLGGFYIEYEDHLEMRSNMESQGRARELLSRAVQTLHFIEATGLSPATTKPQRKCMELLDKLPERDHQSCWTSADGQWLVLDEPYGHAVGSPYHEPRKNWVSAHNLFWATPDWGGLYLPGSAIPHLITADEELLHQVVQAVQSLPPHSTESGESWFGESRNYHTQFVSPAREASGAKRKPRLGTTYGYSKNAIEYRRRPGYKPLWRPDQSMSSANHIAAGEEFKRLSFSRMAYAAKKKLGEMRSELEDWMYAEVSWDGRTTTSAENDAYYGSSGIARYDTVEEQLSAIDRIHSILVSSYPPCTPLRAMLKQLASARIHTQASSSK